MHPEDRTSAKDNGQGGGNGTTHTQYFLSFKENLLRTYYVLGCTRHESYEQNSWSMYS